MQMKRLRALLRYAYENVAFYRRRFNTAKIKPDDIKSVEDLCRIPVLTKLDIQRNFNSLISREIEIERCVKEETSGSTGIPLTVIASKESTYIIGANRLRHYVENGGKLFRDKYVFITSRRLSNERTFLGSLLEHFGVFRRTTMCTQDPIEEVLDRLVNFKPDVIECYPSFLLLLAKELEKKGKIIHPRLVFGGGELLDDRSRKTINSKFGVEMFDLYGCTEAGDVAWECSEHVGYHMNIDLLMIEFVKDGEHVAPGERGEIILTPLWNYAMPLIRYKIGDVGTPSDEHCPCGRKLPLMKVLDGRFEDFIILPNGRVLSPLVTLRYFENIEGISEYRIIQEKIDKLTLQLVLRDGYDEDVVTRLRNRFMDKLGEDITLNIEVMDAIPRDGKLRRVVSHCLPRKRFVF